MIELIIWVCIWSLGLLIQFFLLWRSKRRLDKARVTSTPETFDEYETRVVAREHFIQEAMMICVVIVALSLVIVVLVLEANDTRGRIVVAGLNIIGALIVSTSILRYFGLERFIKQRIGR